MANDLFAPPTAEELKSAQSGRITTPDDLFAPPTRDELAKTAPTTDVTAGKGTLKGQALLDYMKSGQDQSDRGRASLAETSGAARNVADYGGGLMRTGLANDIGLLTGKPLVNTDGVKNAFLGAAPTSAEYMKRGGVPEGPSILGVSARDAAGFATDVATDPVAYVSPIGEAGEAAGKNIYKSGLSKVDAKLAEKGEKPLSDILLQNGAPTGTSSKLQQAIGDIKDKTLAGRQAIYDEGTAAGGKVTPSFDRAQKAITQLRYEGADEAADAAQKILDKNAMRGAPYSSDLPFDQASAIKTNLYKQFDPSTRAALGNFKNSIGLDYKDAIENAAEKYTGKGQDVAQLNDTLGSIKAASKPMAQQVKEAANKKAFGSLDAALAFLHPAAEVSKKAADLGSLTYTRTNLGKGLMNAGESGLLDKAARRGLLNKKNQGSSPGLIDQDGLLKVSGEE